MNFRHKKAHVKWAFRKPSRLTFYVIVELREVERLLQQVALQLVDNLTQQLTYSPFALQHHV